MVDDFGSDSGAVGTGSGTSASAGGRVQAYLATRTGKLVIGALGLVVMLAILAAVVFTFLLRPVSVEPVVTPAPTTATPNVAGGEAAVPQSTKPLSSTFVFRDIFKSTLKTVVVENGSGGDGGTDGTGGAGGTSGDSTDGGDGDNASGDQTDVPENTLVLLGVSTEDGDAVARLFWNGTTYELAEGDQLDETPWKVLEIKGNTVVMLYGDSRVTLGVGQGVSK